MHVLKGDNMTRNKHKPRTVNPVNNVAKPASQSKAVEGEPIYTSGGLKWTLPKVDTRLVENLSENALLAEPANNLRNLIFRGPAQVTVYDPEGETDNDLSKMALTIYEKCDLYIAHQTVLFDEGKGGCSVWSPGWGNIDGVKGACPNQFQNLPWNSFRELAPGYVDVYNDVMPGIVYNRTEKWTDDDGIEHTGKVHAYQTPDDRSTPTEIKNFVIIKDPVSPKPAGKPGWLPVFSLINNYNYADKIINMKLNREGAPSIFPYVEKITAANKEYVEALAQKWGTNTSFILTESMDFKDPKMVLSNIAPERQAELKRRIYSFFNPATFIQKEGNSIGGSDSGGMELIYNYVDTTLTWIEQQITKCTIQKWLDDNGYIGYRAEIKHPRPSVKKDAQILAEVAELAKNGWIDANEARQALPNTDLGDWTPEQIAMGQEQVKGRQAQSNPFGGGFGAAPAPVGNVKSPVERTDTYTQTERELIEATRQCKADVLKIVEQKIKEV
jgi:SOS response regulatory protein OraA/RecX